MSVGVLKHGDRAAREVSERFLGAFASTAALTALAAGFRANGGVALTMDGPKLWQFDSASEETPSTTILDPDAGTGQWVQILAPLDEDTLLALLVSTSADEGATLIGLRDAGAFTTAATVEAALAELYQNAKTTKHCIPVPLSRFRIYSSAADIPVFDDGVADGWDTTAESGGFKFNVASTAKIAASVLLGDEVNDAAAVVVHVLGYRVGAEDVTAALTVGAFFRVAGAAFSADADAGGATDAFAAATTVVSEVTASIAHGDVPAGPSSLLITLVPTAALDEDDLVILEVWLEVTRKILTA